MAAIDLSSLILIDNWPGVPNNNVPIPSGYDLTLFSDTEDWPVGTKIQLYDSTNKGWSTFIYLKYMKGADHDIDLAAGNIVYQWDTTPLYYEVLNDGGEGLLFGPLAVALGAIDYGVSFTAAGKTYKYGWFWCGGVCPEGIVKTAAGAAVLTGNTPTSVCAAAGNRLFGADNAGAAGGLTDILETTVQALGSAYSLAAAA